MNKDDIRIVVLPHGHIWVGHYERDGLQVKVRGRVVRRWGTNRGLAQIANEGPTEKTVLEDMAVSRHHVLAEINTIDCNSDVWVKYLK